MAKRTWLWIILGIVAVLMVGCFAVVGTGIYVFSRHMDIERTDASGAEREFQAVREKFKGETPLFSRGADSGANAAALERRAAEYSGPLPTSLNILAFDPEDGQLVRFSLPFWVVRLGGRKSDLRAGDWRFEDLKLDPEQLERAGPALILDEQQHGGRVVLWTE